MSRIPRDKADDYSQEAAAGRRSFVEEQTGTPLTHVGGGSLDPALTAGNVEHFTGVAQIPIGIAGPLRVDGEHAQGDFFVPLATTEGTLVASYNRGMKLLREAGGVRTTIIDDAMQRAPVFIFEDARQGRDFGAWVDTQLEAMREAAATTTRSGRLRDVEQYAAGRHRFLRCNYTTGDAAGQNMTGKATLAVCQWLLANWEGPAPERFFLEGGMATDKKASQINTLQTRGKRVVAEALIPGALIEGLMRTDAKTLFAARQAASLGGFMAGTTNNGAHAANAICALFIACGQDVANVAESSTAIVHAELRGEDYYYSITLPSLIVATHGGGTGLPTQAECLGMLSCAGSGNVGKFAEICAATVLCGELSLGAAIVAEEWVSSHDRYGRNR